MRATLERSRKAQADTAPLQRSESGGQAVHGADGSALQRSVGNRAVQRMLARPVQRQITLTAEQATFANADEAMDGLQGRFPNIAPSVLRMIFQYMSDRDVVYDNFEALQADVLPAEQHLDVNVSPDGWAVLHRLKAQTFPEFINDKYGGNLDEKQLEEHQKIYEATDARYDPPKFGSGLHSWASNAQWLDHITGRVPKVVLTDLPLGPDNLKRTGRPHEGFTAYVREIAHLLSSGYMPFADEVSPRGFRTVALVDTDRLPTMLREIVVAGKSFNTDDWGTAIKIRDNKYVKTRVALRLFHNAGLPTSLSDQFRAEAMAPQAAPPMQPAPVVAPQPAPQLAPPQPDPPQLDPQRIIALARDVLHTTYRVEPGRFNQSEPMKQLLARIAAEGMSISKKKLLELIKKNKEAVFGAGP